MSGQSKTSEVRPSIIVRLAGDAGDNMHQTGILLSHTAALVGNEFAALPELPPEIRSPSGTLAGVSSFQVQFGSGPILTAGDQLDALVAMNPAALRTHLKDLRAGGILILNRDAFAPAELRKAGYTTDPIEDGSLSRYRVLAVPITTLNRSAIGGPPSSREPDRARNFFALGLLCWLFERPLQPTLHWIERKLEHHPTAQAAHFRSLRAGYHYGETTDQLPVHYSIAPAPVAPGRYRKINGIEGLGLGLVAAAQRADLPMLFASYPSTPAADLHAYLIQLRSSRHQVIQTEDQAAGISAALGAAFGGALGVSACSGPGLDLSSEGLGLAVMTELPLVLIVLQRAGPSTGLPSKTEQADLLAALFGRHGECPLPVLAACSPADCFSAAYEAVQLAVQGMTPVILLADGFLAAGIEPWRIPRVEDLPAIRVHTPSPAEGKPFAPFQRDARHFRPWALPGTPGLEHRLGGLEQNETGHVTYDPLNHERMVQTRAARIQSLAAEVPPLVVEGPDTGDLLVVGWGSTFGSIRTAVENACRQGLSVAHAHLRHLHPFPRNLGEVLARYRRVLVPELNSGQLKLLLRATFLVDAMGLNKVQGRPFLVSEIEAAIGGLLKPGGKPHA